MGWKGQQDPKDHHKKEEKRKKNDWIEAQALVFEKESPACEQDGKGRISKRGPHTMQTGTLLDVSSLKYASIFRNYWEKIY